MHFTNLNFFHYKLDMPYIQSIKQSRIKLNFNKQNMLLWLHFANKLFITKIFLISIYKSAPNSLLKMFSISIYKSVQNS